LFKYAHGLTSAYIKIKDNEENFIPEKKTWLTLLKLFTMVKSGFIAINAVER